MENTNQKRGHEFWTTHIARWESSGQSRRRYCRDEQISYWTFLDWQKRLSNGVDQVKDLVQIPRELFHEAATQRPVMLDLIVNESITIRVHHGFDGELLRTLLQELGVRL
jgi:hypothetical protein